MTEFDTQCDDLPEDVPDWDEETENDDSPVKRELLTIRLFKEAVKKAKGNEGDRILENFAENVLPNLIQQLAGATACEYASSQPHSKCTNARTILPI